ncbi:hypothetical protein CDIK_3913 [Cucumispora dikerogammari]|nr:hypothetical protein CDIK_3913 [Cucumispora dikerogammari]
MSIYYKNKYFAYNNSNQFEAVGEDPRYVGINIKANTSPEHNKAIIYAIIDSKNIVSEEFSVAILLSIQKLVKITRFISIGSNLEMIFYTENLFVLILIHLKKKQ